MNDARDEHQERIDAELEHSEERREFLRDRGFPLVAFVGPAKCGKDYACKAVSDAYDLRFGGTTSKVMCPIVASILDLDEDTAYETRGNYRHAWREVINLFRADDPSVVVRLNFAISDIIGGIRPPEELEAAKADELLDYVIWIERPGIPEDGTLGFDASHPAVDFAIVNYGDEGFGERAVRAYRQCMELHQLNPLE